MRGTSLSPHAFVNNRGIRRNIQFDVRGRTAMLKGWPIALIAATGASAIVGFGVIQSQFAPQAQALFLVFAAVLLLLVVGDKVLGGGGGHAHAGHGHGGSGGGDHAVVMSGRMVGTLTMLAAIGALAYFWTDNQLTGEKIGRFIDRSAVSLSHQAQVAFTRLTAPPADDTPAEDRQDV
jgi:hypothetical protein